MKTVTYRDGVVTFELPDNWVEETDDDGAGMYYEDADDTGLMRLSITTASNSNADNVTAETLMPMLDTLTTSITKTLETLPNGNALLSYITQERGDGKLHVVFFWVVGNPVPPNHARIANFSYTMLATKVANPASQRTVTQLENSVRNAHFASTLALIPDAAADEEGPA
jgi:hypothetical protein